MMLRRCILWLVMMGLIANPLAVVPHAHAGMTAAEQRGHDTTPHFHRHSVHGGAHRHNEDHATHAHHCHEFRSKCATVSLPEVARSVDLETHDSTAIACPLVWLTRGNCERNATVSWQLQMLSAPLICVFTAPMFPRLTSRFVLDPPDAVRNGSGLYLNLRNLRI